MILRKFLRWVSGLFWIDSLCGIETFTILEIELRIEAVGTPEVGRRFECALFTAKSGVGQPGFGSFVSRSLPAIQRVCRKLGQG